MSSKILLADDSLTIQKVVRITLSNEPYEVVDCNDEGELFKSLKIDQFDLLLLDFSLSDKKNGHELAKEIKKEHPDLKIVMMFGTFDTIDEGALKSAGVFDKIVKPFDSTKFINLCREAIQSENEWEAEEVWEKPSAVQEDASVEEDDDAFSHQWVVEHRGKVAGPKEMKMPQPSSLDLGGEDRTASFQNPLSEEVESWGMTVPPSKDEKKGQDQWSGELPPLLAKETENASINGPTVESNKIPPAQDLEYPQEGEKPLDLSSRQQPLSKLIPLNDLVFEEEEETEEGDEIDVSPQQLESLIQDEASNEEFWALDLDKDKNWVEKEDEGKPKRKIQLEDAVAISLEEMPKGVTSSEDKETLNLGKQDLSFGLKNDHSLSQVSLNKLEEIWEKQFNERIQALIEQKVKEYCEKTIEKVAWEIIPDLAENLIKRELQKISDSVLKKVYLDERSIAKEIFKKPSD